MALSASVSQAVLMLEALRDPTCGSHGAAMNALATQSSQPEFIHSILHVFYDVNNVNNAVPLEIRQLSGFVLKNYVINKLNDLPTTLRTEIQLEIINALCDQHAVIRKTSANLIGKITRQYPLDTWRFMFMKVLVGFQDTNSTPEQLGQLDGILGAVRIICEDAAGKLFLDQDSIGPNQARPVKVIMTKCLSLFTHSEVSVRLKALETINSLFAYVDSGSNASANYSESSSSGANTSDVLMLTADFLQGLSVLSQDPLTAVRHGVCRGIVLIATIDISLFGALLPSVMEFGLSMTQDPEDEVAMEACELWLTMLDYTDEEDEDDVDDEGFQTQGSGGPGSGQGTGALFSYLPRLIPILIGRMVLSEAQVQADREVEAAEARGERDINMKPMHHRGSKTGDDAEEDNEEGDAGGDEDESGASTKYTIRKRSAAVLDRLGECFDAEFIFPVALPIIQVLLASQVSCWERESGLMALGALASGCMEAMRRVGMNTVFPYLLANLSPDASAADTPPEVQSISCWVIGRYNQLLFPLPEPEGGAEAGSEAVTRYQTSLQAYHTYYKSVIERLLVLMSGSSAPKVQSSACTAIFGILQTASDDPESHIMPYLGGIILGIQRASTVFGVKNSLLLCDFIGALSDMVGNAFKSQQCCDAILPIVMKKFVSFEDTNMYLFPVMECLVSVIPAVGLSGFQHHAMATLLRCFRINESTLLLNRYADYCDVNCSNGAVVSPAAEGIMPPGTTCFLTNLADVLSQPYNSARIDDATPAKDFAICTLDIISAMISTFESTFVQLLDSTTAQLRTNTVPLYNSGGASVACARTLFMNTVFIGLQDTLNDVKQSAFSLMGVVCGCIPALVLPLDDSGVPVQGRDPRDGFAPQLLGLSLQNIENNFDAFREGGSLMLCNDAVWMLGELLIQIHAYSKLGNSNPEFASYISAESLSANVLPTALKVLRKCNGQQYPQCLRQNISILIGRLGVINASVLAGPVAPNFTAWCK